MTIEKKHKSKFGKDVVNVIRTAMRNNIELTNIADNKANVLLTLNALMITLLAPVVINNMDAIKQYDLGIPLAIMVITSCLTIFISVLVLIPRGFGDKKKSIPYSNHGSPFFFGNFYHMKHDDFQEYFKDVVAKSGDLHSHITEDLFYLGTILGQKMTLIKWAFRIFLVGFFASIILTTIFLFFFE